MRVTAFGVVRPKGKAVLVLVVFCLFIFFLWRSVHNISNHLVSIELISMTYHGKVAVYDEETMKLLEKQFSGAKLISGRSCTQGRYKIILHRAENETTYIFDKIDQLFDLGTGKWLVLQDGGKCLEPWVTKLELKNPYGEFLAWGEVMNIFCKYDKARVVDFDTGISFNVQRRAGSNHADVQPLTAEDSANMKTIYGGRWSWKRRAIIMEVKGRRLAASMNGMPHGAGAITGNNFRGHFCIHFRDSKTHSNEENDAHQLMVWKAAGKLDEMLAGAGPEKIIRTMLVAVEQSDSAVAARLFLAGSQKEQQAIAHRLDSIKWLAAAEISKAGGDAKFRNYSLTVSYGLSDGTQYSNRKVSLTLVRDSGKIPWKVKTQALDQILGPQNGSAQPGDRETVYQDWYVDMEM